MDAERTARADQAFDLYDHGDAAIVAASPWWPRPEADTWLRTVILGRPGDADLALVFLVRFVPGSPEVTECYYLTDPK